jgi:aryl-alcohol dehydrogenase-like predicted oxidoreductase
LGSVGWERVVLGRTDLSVTPLGLGSSYGLSRRDVERAVERGVNYLYWGSVQRPGFGAAIAAVARRRRERIVTVVQSYSRVPALLRLSVEQALLRLRLDHTDILLLGWYNEPPPRRVLDAALALRERGRVRHLMVSSHRRALLAGIAADPTFGAIMVRYHAAHPGAEEDVFPHLGEPRPGVVAYTATRWGGLCDPRLTPPGEPTPRGSDCYRFALSHPSVNLVLAGPSGAAELDEALAALDRGPMSADELAWMRRVGAAVKRASLVGGVVDAPVTVVDRLLGRLGRGR